jgi:hypothetical protein
LQLFFILSFYLNTLNGHPATYVALVENEAVCVQAQDVFQDALSSAHGKQQLFQIRKQRVLKQQMRLEQQQT